MDHYLVIKTHVDDKDDINVSSKLFYKQIDARIEYLTLIDELKAQLSLLYRAAFGEFEIEDYGDIIKTNNSYAFKDYDGLHNIKIELKRV